MAFSRRDVLQGGGILLSCVVAGQSLWLTPRAAHAAQVPYRVLTADEVATVQGLAEALVPGAREAGIAQYLDKQLARAGEGDSLLMLKYLGVDPGDYVGFYRASLASAATAAQNRHGKPWPELNARQAAAVLAAMAADEVPDWSGPPASFAFFVLRADAADVVYGTTQGFERLGVPYMPHLAPAEPW